MKHPTREIVEKFKFEGEFTEAVPYGSGHINDTYLIVRQAEGTVKKYILQRINKNVFKNPEQLMDNISKVTAYLKEKIVLEHGNPERETLHIVQTKDGENCYRDVQGEYWRAYLFIEDAVSYDKAESPQLFYESAVTFGRFQAMLADFDASTLHETIPGFHDTHARYQAFLRAVKEDKRNRAKEAEKEIAFLCSREELTKVFGAILKNGENPLRVTHNDTKLNNILMDRKTGKGLCVIDLDTVMPGPAVFDFGDAIRFGASTAAEDEQELERVALDLELFELYVKGFIEGCDGKLTEKEIDRMPLGAMVMTLECGIRFLTDYLEGDCYFKIHREGHNLDRCRTQLKLLQDMEKKEAAMRKIVDQYKTAR